MFGLFNGIVRPYASLPAFWKYLMYWANPSTYWIAGLLAASFDGIPVECAEDETARFDSPPGQTCLDYAGAFANSTGGYILNPTATSGCQYCPYRSGNNFLQTLNVSPDQKWRST